MNTLFSKTLLKWNRSRNKREMPWKGQKDPYLIWLSEIILQQTRTEQGLPYFLKFKSKYPTVKKLAAAPEDEVMRIWQGLGYYSRARNLHFTAKYIAEQLHGCFPDNFHNLKKLKGVGDYTAAAISSFAFGEKKAVVDGNVIRVLSRYFGIDEAFDTTTGKKKFAELAQSLIPAEAPGEYNQAIMDFGASVCVPQNPDCADCPFSESCFANRHDLIKALPYRAKRPLITERHFVFLHIQKGNQLMIQKRQQKDIWQNLYQLPMIESKKKLSGVSLRKNIEKLLNTNDVRVINITDEKSQLLTHRKLYYRIAQINADNYSGLKEMNASFVALKDLHGYAFPRLLHLYLQQIGLL